MRKLITGVLVCILVLPFINTKAAGLGEKTSSALSHYIMGVMYEDLGDIDKAIDEYKKALKADSKSSLLHLNLASSYIKKNDFPRAIEELRAAAELDPEAIEPHAILAILYSSQDKLDMASAEYELALKNASKLEPSNIEIYRSLGLVYLQQRRFKEAQQTYRLITELAPGDPQAHFFLGSIYSELGNVSLAEKEMKRALEIKSDYHEALNFLGYLYIENNKNLNHAEKLIRRALELEPNNGAYIDSLGWLYFKRGKAKEAIRELERAGALYEDPIIFDHLGDAYLKARDTEKAKLNWQRSLKLDPKQASVIEKIKGVK